MVISPRFSLCRQVNLVCITLVGYPFAPRGGTMLANKKRAEAPYFFLACFALSQARYSSGEVTVGGIGSGLGKGVW